MTKSSPVEILQYAWEFDIVLDIYKRVKPKTVLEIGSLYGGTLYHWLKQGEPNLSAVSIDLFSTVDYGETVKLWKSWEGAEQKLSPIRISSTSPAAIEFVKNEFKDGIDWLFIDGDHSYEGARADYENYFPLLKNGGYCIFHDIVGEPGVCKYWSELKMQLNGNVPVIEICHSKYHLGIGIIQKITTQ